MREIKFKRRWRSICFMIIILSTGLVFGQTQKRELGDAVYVLGGKVIAEEVESPQKRIIDKTGTAFAYNYNSLAKKTYTSNEAAARQVFAYINEIRAGKGLPPLEWDDQMLRSTTIRAMEIGERWSHTRPDGSSFATTSKIIRSECLGRTNSMNPKTIVHAWLHSKAGHREAVLSTEYTKVYIACVVSESKEWPMLYAMHQRN